MRDKKNNRRFWHRFLEKCYDPYHKGVDIFIYISAAWFIFLGTCCCIVVAIEYLSIATVLVVIPTVLIGFYGFGMCLWFAYEETKGRG